MIRWSVLAAGAAVVAGAAFVTGASIPPKPSVDAVAPAAARATVIGQRIGFFNMAKVMRDYNRAKTSVARLNDRKNRMSANLLSMRAMYIELQKGVVPAGGILLTPDQLRDREDIKAREMVIVARRMEDMDRDINRLLNNQATEIITELYDEIHAVVVDVAREHGLSAVMAYPDAVTPEELNNPMVKELKLKPPAAQPFYLDPSVDYTDELLQRLNAKPAANGGK